MREDSVQHGSATGLAMREAKGRTELEGLMLRSEVERIRAGYGHTLREILQQPRTWKLTAEQMIAIAPALLSFVDGVQAVVLTGSGSSEYAGDCVRGVLQKELHVGAQTLGGGVLLTDGGRAIVPQRPCLMISLARSGDSPESLGAVSSMLEWEPGIRHMVIACNKAGRLPEAYENDGRVMVVLLDEATNDRSLVMTSSFTNMVLASRSLGMLREPKSIRVMARTLSEAAEDILQTKVDQLAEVACRNFDRVLFLATGPRLGAAREASLKMAEMTAGRVMPMCETYLGLRHGPMSTVHPNTLVVCFLSSSSPSREYEVDLVRELQKKNLGLCKVLFGADIPEDLVDEGDVAVQCAALAEVGDENAPVLDTLIGQLLAFFRCMKEGLTPDSPSENGIINRVVDEFALHPQKH